MGIGWGVDVRVDLHVHSSEYSADASSTMLENVLAASSRGLKVLGLADHIRGDSTWIVGRDGKLDSIIGDTPGMRILRGAEAKIKSSGGVLDAPRELGRLDYLLIADHQYPGEDGPVSPEIIGGMISSGEMSRRLTISNVISAMINAVLTAPVLSHPNVLVHPFSLLPKLGLDESELLKEELSQLAVAMLWRGTLLEVNEKWRCPGRRSIGMLVRSGVELVGGSDSHVAGDVGRYEYVLGEV